MNQQILDKLKHLTTDTNPIIASGSGKTKVFVYSNLVLKIFPDTDDISTEIEALQTIQSKYIVKMIDFVDNNSKAIFYEKITPLSQVNSPDIITELLQITSALFDIHYYGFIHGDVAVGNIGINEKSNFVLYDFESAKKTSSDELRFKDVEMFLEDMIIDLPKKNQTSTIISDLLNILRATHRNETKTQRKNFKGEIVERISYSYNYKPESFGIIVSNYFKSIS